MKGFAHRASILFYSLIIISAIILPFYYGISYYELPIEKRVFNSLHKYFKPSGIIGHGYGIIGTIAMLVGVGTYMLRKRVRKFSRIGVLKYWLEFHIFLCTLGPILILYHTSFKFGGLVSISFWSMLAVFFSGIIGRFIYQQIPRTLEGHELTYKDLEAQSLKFSNRLYNEFNISPEILEKIEKEINIEFYKKVSLKGLLFFIIEDFLKKRKLLSELKKEFKKREISKYQIKTITELLKNKISIVRKMGLLHDMLRLFNYWHIIHLPFALIMLVIMVIHVFVTILFGYRWIFNGSIN